MRFDNPLADGESQPGATDAFRALNPVKLIEDTGKVFGWDTLSTIQDLEADSTLQLIGFDFDGAILR